MSTYRHIEVKDLERGQQITFADETYRVLDVEYILDLVSVEIVGEKHPRRPMRLVLLEDTPVIIEDSK